MNSHPALTDSEGAGRSFAIWALLAFLAWQIAGDVRAIYSMHLVIIEGPTASRLYYIYLSAVSLAVLRIGSIALAMVLLWRRHQAGLVIAAILFLANLYTVVLRDMTGGAVPSAFGPPATEGDAIARAVGRYSVHVTQLVVLAWCAFAIRTKKYFALRTNTSLERTREG